MSKEEGHKVPDTKGTTLFAVGQVHGRSCLACVVRKRVELFELNDAGKFVSCGQIQVSFHFYVRFFCYYSKFNGADISVSTPAFFSPLFISF